MNVKRHPTTVILIAMLAACCGCELADPKGRSGATAPDLTGSSEWPFAPATMRIHPFTQFSIDTATGKPILDARIELLDPMGDVTKGIGTLRFELLATSDRASASQVSDRRIDMWDVSLITLDENHQHFDRITRTYGFKLKLDAIPDNNTRLRLQAQFTKPSGRRLSADMLLKSPRPTSPAG